MATRPRQSTPTEQDSNQDGKRRSDNRRVALIKSLATSNRFYALVAPESGIRNADTVEEVPDDLLAGIAYPCLEDALNDFAIIRTTYETLHLFPDDAEMHRELLDMINDARGNLLRRLMELISRLTMRTAFFLGTGVETIERELERIKERERRSTWRVFPIRIMKHAL